MTFREFNQRFMEPGAIVLMIVGILFLCQPWVAVLHQWSVLVMLVGLIGFNVSAHVLPPEQKVEENDTGPVSVAEMVKAGDGNG